MHAVMRKRKELMIFDDVDISITVEKNVKGNKVPMPLVIRKCNEKTVMEITHEIRETQTKEIDRTAVLGNNKSDKLVKMYPYIPKFLRKWGYNKILNNPYSVKKYMGTVLLTSVGMFGKVSGWPIITATHPLAFASGSIAKKLKIAAGTLEEREYLSITIAIDHRIIDGGPAARFIEELNNLLENAHGLAANE